MGSTLNTLVLDSTFEAIEEIASDKDHVWVRVRRKDDGTPWSLEMTGRELPSSREIVLLRHEHEILEELAAVPGRTGRPTDRTSDLYSLGITLYKLLTGTLPFTSADPLHLVHSHIARTPTPLHELDADTPKVVSAIVSPGPASSCAPPALSAKSPPHAEPTVRAPSTITDPNAVRRILDHLNLPSHPRTSAPARDPTCQPMAFGFDAA